MAKPVLLLLLVFVFCTVLHCPAKAGVGANEESWKVLDTSTSPAPAPGPSSPPPLVCPPRAHPYPNPINCTSSCDTRCSAANLHKRCLKYCHICCCDCNCVPSGQHGNEDECPCYRDKKNSRHGDKCP